MREIAVIAVLVVLGVSLAEFGRRAALGRRMEHAMGRLRTTEPQQVGWPEAGLRVEPGRSERSADVLPGSELLPGSNLRRAS
jgi:hypothetical protein